MHLQNYLTWKWTREGVNKMQFGETFGEGYSYYLILVYYYGNRDLRDYEHGRNH